MFIYYYTVSFLYMSYDNLIAITNHVRKLTKYFDDLDIYDHVSVHFNIVANFCGDETSHLNQPECKFHKSLVSVSRSGKAGRSGFSTICRNIRASDHVAPYDFLNYLPDDTDDLVSLNITISKWGIDTPINNDILQPFRHYINYLNIKISDERFVEAEYEIMPLPFDKGVFFDFPIRILTVDGASAAIESNMFNSLDQLYVFRIFGPFIGSCLYTGSHPIFHELRDVRYLDLRYPVLQHRPHHRVKIDLSLFQNFKSLVFFRYGNKLLFDYTARYINSYILAYWRRYDNGDKLVDLLNILKPYSRVDIKLEHLRSISFWHPCGDLIYLHTSCQKMWRWNNHYDIRENKSNYISYGPLYSVFRDHDCDEHGDFIDSKVLIHINFWKNSM